MRTLIASDIHNGDPASRTIDFLQFLWTPDAAEADRIIIPGDLHDSDGSPEPYLLDTLARIARSKELIILRGNHDPHNNAVAQAIGAWTGTNHNLYVMEDGGKRIAVTHGHEDPLTGEAWDPNLAGYPGPTALANWVENGFCLLGRYGRAAAIGAHHLRKWLFDVRVQVRNHALEFGFQHGWDVIVCGHTHLPEGPIERNGVIYLNDGSWVETVNTYVLVENGVATLKEYQ